MAAVEKPKGLKWETREQLIITSGEQRPMGEFCTLTLEEFRWLKRFIQQQRKAEKKGG